LDGGVDDALGDAVLTHVAQEKLGRAAGRADAGLDGLGARLIAAGEEDARARRRKRPRAGLADAGGAPRDDRDASSRSMAILVMVASWSFQASAEAGVRDPR
jgi:hypothetical protein